MSSTTPVESGAAKSAWVQLYEARNIPVEVQTRSPGRPPGPVPRRKVGMTLSQGEIAEIEVWQERLSTLLHRKISIGETVGLLARLFYCPLCCHLCPPISPGPGRVGRKNDRPGIITSSD